MAGPKKPTFGELRRQLESEMLRASGLKTEIERRGFVNRTFTSLYKASQEKQVTHDEYIQLINKLAAFRQGEYSDYLDTLAGAAQMGLLEMVIQGEMAQFSPEQARQRRQEVTDLTGMEPHQPDSENQEDDQQQNAKQPPEIDLEHIARMWPAAMAMATKMRRDEEVELEHTLAALVRDFLVERGAISEEQRELVQMEIHPTDLAALYSVAYVRPGAEETPEHPRLLICARRQDGWHVSPMPHEPF
jgi:hypothetical protein